MIIIGEKINGSIPSVAKAIAEKNEDFIRDLAVKQAEAGATFIDVCASVAPEIEVETLKWLINVVQDAVDTPLSIDSPNEKCLVEVIPVCKKPGLVNSVSMEGNKVDTIFPIIANTKWECFALLSDDKGIPRTAERRLEVFDNLMVKAKQYGIAPARLHIDPLVEMLCTSEDGISMVTTVIREIKSRYPSIHVSGAISNISFNLPARKLVNMGFVCLAMNAGMDSGIFDPLDKTLMGIIYATEALLGYDELCIEYIGAYREGIIAAPAVKK
ncbi:MAG: methyltetrahydrofolate cobalamin methyltransferase [Clostridiales bacterium]|nr:methyltetrahydrofolate cobalamin methyltransferase [Clostridiales bacterium]